MTPTTIYTKKLTDPPGGNGGQGTPPAPPGDDSNDQPDTSRSGGKRASASPKFGIPCGDWRKEVHITPCKTESEKRQEFALSVADKIRTPEDFAIVLLTYMGLPVNKANIEALLQWESTEGGHWKWQQAGCQSQGPSCAGWHNPLNTGYLHEPGDGGPATTGASRPHGPAAEYPTWKMGIEAMAHTLRESQFAPILNVLRRSEGAAALRAAVAKTPYGTINKNWTTKPIGTYAYSDYRKSPFLYKG